MIVVCSRVMKFSDFVGRRSTSKEGTAASYLRSCEEKENDEKDQIMKASKLQSPAKGSKHFMSPTISAASKFTPSPRKKVLVERTDPVRTSISLSDGKAMFFSNMSSSTVSEDFESKSEMGSQKTESSLDLNVADLENIKAVEEDHPLPKPKKRVSFSDVPSDSNHSIVSLPESVVITDSDSTKLETSFENEASSCPSVSPAIAPLDADPSFPPYDPKTNYLSPRPQFLHYKPNPRIGILLNKEKDEFGPVDDSIMAEIMSENFSDSECTEETEEEEGVEVDDSADMVIGLHKTEDDHHVHEPSESLPLSTTDTGAISEENLLQRTEKKSWALSKLMCFSILMMFSIACLSIYVARSPSIDEFVPKDLSFSDLSGFYHHQSRVAAASAKVKFNQLARHVNQLSVNSLSFISKLYNELGEGEKLIPLQFMNLSDLHKSTWNEGNFLKNEIREEQDELELEEDEVEDLDIEMDISDEKAYEEADLDEEAYGEADSDENFEKELVTEEHISEADETSPEYAEEIQSLREVVSTISEENSAYQLAAIPPNQEIELQTGSKVSSETVKNSADQSSDIPHDQEGDLQAAPEREQTEKSHDDINFDPSSSSAHAVITTSVDHESPSYDADNYPTEVVQTSLIPESTQSEGVQTSLVPESTPSENKFVEHYAKGIICSLFAALLTVALAYKYKRNPSLVKIVQADDTLLSKHNSNKYQEKAYSQNWQTEVDEIGGSSSCPSEMSSFQKSASYYNNSKKDLLRGGGGGASEAQSLERKARKYTKRESLASSSASEFSPSYGSFTTFERIPIKLVSRQYNFYLFISLCHIIKTM